MNDYIVERDQRGRTISRYSRARVLKWATRWSFSSMERRLLNASWTLANAGRVLGLPDITMERAVYLFKSIINKETSFQQYPRVIGAALYLATREGQVHVKPTEVALAVQALGHALNTRVLMRCVARVRPLIKLKTIGPDTNTFLAKVESLLPAGDRDGCMFRLRPTVRMLESVVDQAQVARTSTFVEVRAAALIYAAGKIIEDNRLTERVVCTACRTSDVSLRRVYNAHYRHVVRAVLYPAYRGEAGASMLGMKINLNTVNDTE